MHPTGSPWQNSPRNTRLLSSSKANSLDALADLTQKIQAKGVEDLVLDLGGKNLGEWLTRSTQARRLALKNFRALGYPTIFLASQTGQDKEAVYAAQAIAKYAGFVVLDTFAPEMIYPLLVLRENIYTDPQKPIQVQPGIYEINAPKPDSPVLVTTNFSITYFSVANEVEGSGLPAWLLVTDAEGMSVLTAWAAGKFDAERIAKAVKSFDVAKQGQQETARPAGSCRRAVRRARRGTPRLGNPRRPARGGGPARIHEAGAQLTWRVDMYSDR